MKKRNNVKGLAFTWILLFIPSGKIWYPLFPAASWRFAVFLFPICYILFLLALLFVKHHALCFLVSHLWSPWFFISLYWLELDLWNYQIDVLPIFKRTILIWNSFNRKNNIVNSINLSNCKSSLELIFPCPYSFLGVAFSLNLLIYGELFSPNCIEVQC